MTRLPLTLQTRVGRRIALLFVLSALVPILALGALGYAQVRSQLLQQSETRLSQAAKAVGMGLLDQLRASVSQLMTIDTVRGTALALAVEHVPAPARAATPTGAAISIEPAAGDSGAIWIVLPSRALRVRLRSDFVFSGARDRAAGTSAEMTICIRDVRSERLLFCDGEAGEGPRVVAQWDLFLGYDFATTPWRIEIAEPRAAVLAPVLAFRRTLLATLVAVMGLAVALSSVQVRRSLEPLQALRDGTRRLTEHDFSQRVDVRSGDEFQELAESFNQMTTELDGQFKDNRTLIKRLNALSWGALAALARTVDASSPWTAGHSERVTALSMRMAERLGLGRTDRDTLHRGGLLHDIGKIGIAPDILDKPGKLDRRELARIREHPVLGAKILEPIEAFTDAVPIVRHHHEKFDGSGYPDGLVGEAIPYLARLLAVADVYDALVSERPYRPGWEHEAALAEIRNGRGTHFDPAMLEAFFEVIAEEGDAARLRPLEVLA